MPATNKSCETIGSILAITSYDTNIDEPSEVLYIHHSQLGMKHFPMNTKREEASILLLDKEGRTILEFREGLEPRNYLNETERVSDILPQMINFLGQ